MRCGAQGAGPRCAAHMYISGYQQHASRSNTIIEVIVALTRVLAVDSRVGRGRRRPDWQCCSCLREMLSCVCVPTPPNPSQWAYGGATCEWAGERE